MKSQHHPLRPDWMSTKEPFSAVSKHYFSSSSLAFTYHPDQEALHHSNLALSMKELGFLSLDAFYDWSIRDREAFWEYVTQKMRLQYDRPDQFTFYGGAPRQPLWLLGAKLNIADSCLQHPEQQVAVHYASEEDASLKTLTYGQLKIEVCKASHWLAEKGVCYKEPVALLMPLNKDALVVFLALISTGATVVCIPDSFSTEEIIKRVDITQTQKIIYQKSYHYGGKVIDIEDKVKKTGRSCFSIEDMNASIGRDETFLSGAYHSLACLPEDHIAILFSSGTTGTPKAIPWHQHTPIKCFSDAYFHMNFTPNDIATWTTGMGWMMAPWLFFSALLNGSSLALFEGSPATASYTSFLIKAKVSFLGLIPSVVKKWRKEQYLETKEALPFKTFASTGEPSDPEDYLYLSYLTDFKAPIIEYCGGTEIGGGYMCSSVMEPLAPGLFSGPALGTELTFIDKEGNTISKEGIGEAFITPPSIGLSTELINQDHEAAYYSRYEHRRTHGDNWELLLLDGKTYYKSLGRADDTMNLGGIKVSAVEIENVLKTDDMEEIAAVSFAEHAGPEQLALFITGNPSSSEEELKNQFQERINKLLNPLFRVAKVIKIEALPRTPSNKVMRRSLRDQVTTSKA
jgi:acetyl-CoA synthetase